MAWYWDRSGVHDAPRRWRSWTGVRSSPVAAATARQLAGAQQQIRRRRPTQGNLLGRYSSFRKATCWATTVLIARQRALGFDKIGHLPRAARDYFDHDNKGTGATQHFDRQGCSHDASNVPAATATAAERGTTTTLGDRLSAACLSTNKTPLAHSSLQLPS